MLAQGRAPVLLALPHPDEHHPSRALAPRPAPPQFRLRGPQRARDELHEEEGGWCVERFGEEEREVGRERGRGRGER